jgi:SulP family sulfate permease
MTDPSPVRRWRQLPSVAATGVASAVTHAPENAAYGLMALAPLGAAFGPVAMGLALLGAAVGSATASAVGSGRLVGDAGAALALLTGGLVAALLPLVPGAGAAAAWQVLVLVALGIAAGGVLTALFGLLRIGGVVKYTPYPVRIGLSSGVGMLLIASALPAALGHGFGAGLGGILSPLPGAALVSLCALAISWLAAVRHARVPPVLLGLAAATLLHTALHHAAPGLQLGPTVGVPQLPASWFNGTALSLDWLAMLANPAVLALLGSFAATAAVVVSLDTLLAASIIDGRLRQTRNANRELVAQGLANVASAAAGGLPASPALPASLGLVGRMPGQRHIVAAYAGALLAVLLGVPALLGALPVSAVGGVLVFLGAEMVSPTLWQAPMELGRLLLRRNGAPAAAWRRGRPLAANWAVAAAVALSALLAGLAQAVAVGATLSVLLFVRANMRDVVRRVWTGDTRQSLKTRPTEVAEVLRRSGQRNVLLEIEGALFFGTADALRDRLHRLAPQADTAILDLRQVSEIDVTAARILHEVAEDWQQMGKPLVFAEWPAGDPRRDVLEAVAAEASGVPDSPDAPDHSLHFQDHVDVALEQAEEALLHRLQIDRPVGAVLALGETTIAQGLSADELALLQAELTAHDFPRGHVMFRAGDPGDALFISLRGEISLRMPGTTRRLASFAPGVTIGEMAVLARTRRSAEAVAESDVSALGLSVAAFERLMQQHPELAAKLSRNIAVHLSDRVRMLTGDLAGWVSRSDAVRPATPDSPTIPP